jgi:hypothetical protein
MLLAEELALAAIDPESGRHPVGARSHLNACLAALLVAELLLDGCAQPSPEGGVVVPDGVTAPATPALRAAAAVVQAKGPKLKAVLSHMDRGLEAELGTGTWDTAVAGLVAAGVVGVSRGGVLPRLELTAPSARDAVVARLQTAGASDGPLDARTAVLLRMTGPAQLLEVVAPDRATRKHARRRIDSALETADLQAVNEAVRKVLAEAAAVIAAAGAATVIAGSGS